MRESSRASSASRVATLCRAAPLVLAAAFSGCPFAPVFDAGTVSIDDAGDEPAEDMDALVDDDAVDQDAAVEDTGSSDVDATTDDAVVVEDVQTASDVPAQSDARSDVNADSGADP